MTTPHEALNRLDDHAKELDQLSRALAAVQRELEPIDRAYQEFVDEFEVGLWLKSEEDGGPRLPSEAMRVKLARRAMAAELLGRRDGLRRKRERVEQRIRDLEQQLEERDAFLIEGPITIREQAQRIDELKAQLEDSVPPSELREEQFGVHRRWITDWKPVDE